MKNEKLNQGVTDILVNKYADIAFSYAIDKLWKDKTVYDGVKIKALRHIRAYFLPAKSEKQLKKWLDEFYKRIDLAVNYLNRGEAPTIKNPNPKSRWSWLPFPDKYFDPTNKLGFSSTKYWLEKSRKTKQENQEKKKIKDALLRFKADKSVSNFNIIISEFKYEPELAIKVADLLNAKLQGRI